MRTTARSTLVIVVSALLAAALVGLVLADRSSTIEDRTAAFQTDVDTAAGAVDIWVQSEIQWRSRRGDVLLSGEVASDALEQALAGSGVPFAVLTDPAGVALTWLPERIDRSDGESMVGQFGHVDAVLAGEDVGAMTFVTTNSDSGVFLGLAVPVLSADGERVLSTVFDPSRTSLPSHVIEPLRSWAGAATFIVDDGGIILVGPGSGTSMDEIVFETDERRHRASADTELGWSVVATVPRAEIVGGTLDVATATIFALLFVLTVASAVWALRNVAASQIDEEEVARLRTAQEETEAALVRSNRALGAFAESVAHDLRTPLTSVAGYSDLLATNWTTFDDSVRTELLGRIATNARRAADLTGDLLAASRPKRVPHQEIAVADLAGRIDDLLGTTVAEAGAVVSLDARVDAITAPRAAVERVLVNLVTNSLKYRDPLRAPRIVVEVDGTRSAWQISVIDNGIGVEPEQLRRIFDAGFRGGDSGALGEGLGLDACRRHVTDFGGRIWAEQSPDGGLIVRFTVPRPLTGLAVEHQDVQL